ncbi:MAG TPA: beta-galactosidase [Candidatus Aminicenantes bacterium]|nr:MAG: Beta-galactosidase precursor [Candidatus Aminicenantes bacterium ADurb.Bin147]HPH43125.1 beta-galactosidase [Candidatus Aminicenantes bacterium]
MKKKDRAPFITFRPSILKSAAFGVVFAAVSSAAPFLLHALPAPDAPPAAAAGSPPPAAPRRGSPPPSPEDGAVHTFGFQGTEFILDGKPFQIQAGEMHFQRIPREYWKDRLRKARALGLNTVGTYVFWNALEPEPGQWDFSGRNDLAGFIAEAREAGLWVLIRPGPYVCAEWDFGGLPAWLLRIPDIKVRCSDPRYLAACGKYIEKIAGILRPLQVHEGGPVLMVQIENEYGSYGNDRGYLPALKALWEKNGLRLPFSTADGAAPHMLEAGTIPGCAIGLDPAASGKEFAEAEKLGRNVPVFCSELYPGWLTHWGEPWARTPAEDVLKDLRWLLENGKSFSLYVLHGGTNFGFWAGANMGKTYQPDVTSYDYDAPLNERGDPTPKYFAVRDLLAQYRPAGTPPPPDLPDPLPAVDTPDVSFTGRAALFDNLPAAADCPQPRPMEMFGQNAGFILYRTELSGRRSGTLAIQELHDYAVVSVDGKILGTLDRGRGESTMTIPPSNPPARRLDILVEGLGRINYGPHLLDRKGITDRVTLEGMTLMSWNVVPLPMDEAFLEGLRFVNETGAASGERPGVFFRGFFDLMETGDTFLDLSGWRKGVVWVNGRNLGRYWDIGPQKRLFCPGPFLRKGRNTIVVFDLHRTAPAGIRGFKTPE